MSRAEQLQIITKRLILLTVSGLGCVAVILAIAMIRGGHLIISALVFGCGLLGGFVSIQQRLSKIGDEELDLLSRSWFQILLIPVYGGIFAELLFVAFLGHIVEGQLFPKFVYPSFTKPLPAPGEIGNFLKNVDPATGADLARLSFWSFVAGFSERLVPQIIDKAQRDDNGAKR